MRSNLFRPLCVVLLAALTFAASGCDQDFYLSESEAAAYAGLFADESSANNFISTSLPGQTLNIQFDNTSHPPTIRSTNLVTLMRNYTTLGLVEGTNHQVRLDRLNAQLQTQLERYIRSKLQIYQGINSAGVQLTQLTSVQINFRNVPTFTFHPERQSIAFSLTVNLIINGTIRVDALDPFTNFLFNVNGTYPLAISVNNLNLSGEASLSTPFADAGEIGFSLTPTPGTISVTDAGSSSAPAVVKNGVASLIRQQLSQPLNENFTQLYTYFALTGLGLTQATAQTPSSLTYAYQARPENAKPLMHIVARAADGKLYHLRKTEGGQSVINTVQPFPSLQTRIENEPALFASATDQLELAATDVNGDLVYAHWRDETWVNQVTFAPPSSSSTAGYTGKPALVASAPGQVEVVVVGRNGGLWHLRRVNGQWYTPAAINILSAPNVRGAPYRDPVAVLTGNKVVVVFVDYTSRLQAIAYDLESGLWGQATLIPTQEFMGYAPTAAASGDGRVDVVYVGTSGTPYHRVLDVQAARFSPGVAQTGISVVGNETNIGGVVNAAPVLVCSGYKQLELIGRGTDNHLYHNHYVGPSSPAGFVDGRLVVQGWQGWGDLNGNFSGSVTLSGGSMTAFAAAATRTGKVTSVSVAQPSALDNSTQQLLYYNSYDSERYGTQPWNTVLWRGYEQAGQQRFVGQPALALTDRNFAVAYVDGGLTVQRARLPESNAASFAGVDNSTQISYSTPVDPALVSSVPGQLDVLLVGTDGRLRHIRSSDHGGSLTTLLSSPSGVTFRAQPAVVGYGNGQLEVVAVGSNNALYHWRFQNGVWSGATQLSGTVISQPVLVHLGAGQLVTLAVGTNQRLYLWYFSSGAWSVSRQVSTSFLVNQNLFGPTAASSWGEGSIDLALVEAQTGVLYHGRLGGVTITGIAYSFSLTPGRAFTSLGGDVIDTPVLTALSATRLNILAVGTDHALYSNWSSLNTSVSTGFNQAPPIVWSGYNYLGGTNVLLGGVAKAGANELTAVCADTSGRLLRGRYAGAKWTQFHPVIGQNPQTQLNPPLYRPSVVAFGN